MQTCGVFFCEGQECQALTWPYKTTPASARKLTPRKRLCGDGIRVEITCKIFESVQIVSDENVQQNVQQKSNSQAVFYAVRARMVWLGAAARVWRILHRCFLAVETTDLRRAKI